MHGIRVADGTDCAARTRIESSRWAQTGCLAVLSGRTRGSTAADSQRRSRARSRATSCEHRPVDDDQPEHEERQRTATPIVSRIAADAPPLDRDRLAGGSERAELGQEVAPVLLHHRAQLRRARHAARGGERLRDLVGREVAQRVLVDALRVASAARGPASCSRGRRPGATGTGRTWTKKTSISCSSPSLHHEVGGLDVAVREALVPHLAHEPRALGR